MADVFPAGQPFKILYSIKTLKVCLGEQLLHVGSAKTHTPAQSIHGANCFKGIENPRLISRGVQLLIAALTDSTTLEASTDNRLKLSIAANLSDCLLTFLKGMLSDLCLYGYSGC